MRRTYTDFLCDNLYIPRGYIDYTVDTHWDSKRNIENICDRLYM